MEKHALFRLPGRHQHRTHQQYQERCSVVKFKCQIVNVDFTCFEFDMCRNGGKCAQHN